MSEQLPVDLEHAIWYCAHASLSGFAPDDDARKASDAIRAEHAQRVTLQHHSCDLAQRVADLQAERDEQRRLFIQACEALADLGTKLGLDDDENDPPAIFDAIEELQAERDEMRARLAEIEVQEPVAWQSKFTNDPQWTHCTKEDFDWVRAFPANWPNCQLRALFTRPVTAQAVPEPVNGLVSVFGYDEVLTFTFCTEADADKFMARFEPTVDSAAQERKA